MQTIYRCLLRQSVERFKGIVAVEIVNTWGWFDDDGLFGDLAVHALSRF